MEWESAHQDRAELYRWVYYLTSGLLFASTVLRALLEFQGAERTEVLTLLLGCLVLFVIEPPLTRRWGGWFTLYLVLQSILLAVLVAQSKDADFFAILFGVLAMQAMQHYPPRWGWATVGAFVPAMALPLLTTYGVGGEALVLLLVNTTVAWLVASYALAMRRAAEAASKNQATAAQLRAANRQVEEYAAQLERLAVARERHRLAHDLHDSVTQTIFSMTLTTQSALLLIDQDPPRVAAQLDHLAQLTRGALAEMQLLISELRPDARPDARPDGGSAGGPEGKPEEGPDGSDSRAEGRPYGGLVAGLEHHLDERAEPQGISTSVSIEGEGALSAAEERTLLRIGQEAINNILKHAESPTATVRLRLTEPYRMEVVDEGRGFTPGTDDTGGGLGLDSMRERAAEIGWAFDVVSEPGVGTRVVVEKHLEEG